MAIAKHREIAELMTHGLYGDKPLDAADQFRLDHAAGICLGTVPHLRRARRGVFPKGTLESTAGALLRAAPGTARGAAWSQRAGPVGFLPAYVADVDWLPGEIGPAKIG